MSFDLAIRATAREMAAVFQSAAADIRTAFALIVSAEERLNAAFTLGGRGGMSVTSSPSGYGERFDQPELALDRLRKTAWLRIAERLELPRVMSIARWEALEKEIQSGKDLPDVTEENVAAFAAQHLRALPQVHEEAVREVFDWLRPHDGTSAAQYKTNSRVEIGARVVLTRAVEKSLRKWYVRKDEHQLRALENVFRVLDGKGWTSGNYRSDLHNAIEADGGTGEGETEYFAYRCHKNQSLHLRFKRTDLVAKINQIAGGASLRPGKAT